MAGDAALALHKTFDEYLAMERASDVRLQWVAGEIFAMAGGTPEHSVIKMNLAISIGGALRGKRCLALDSDQKVDILEADIATYPDLTVVCGPLVRSPRDKNALTNPTLVVEVLSRATADYDLGAKRRAYQRLSTLRQMLFVSPETQAIERWTRGDDGTWEVEDVGGDPIELASIDVAIGRAEVFARVEEVAAGG